MDSAAIVLKNIRRDIPAIKPLAVKVICLQRRLLDAVQHYQVRNSLVVIHLVLVVSSDVIPSPIICCLLRSGRAPSLFKLHKLPVSYLVLRLELIF